MTHHLRSNCGCGCAVTVVLRGCEGAFRLKEPKTLSNTLSDKIQSCQGGLLGIDGMGGESVMMNREGNGHMAILDVEGNNFAMEFPKSGFIGIVDENKLLDLFLVNTRFQAKAKLNSHREKSE